MLLVATTGLSTLWRGFVQVGYCVHMDLRYGTCLRADGTGELHPHARLGTAWELNWNCMKIPKTEIAHGSCMGTGQWPTVLISGNCMGTARNLPSGTCGLISATCIRWNAPVPIIQSERTAAAPTLISQRGNCEKACEYGRWEGGDGGTCAWRLKFTS